MTRPDGPDNQEFDDPMLPPLDALYGSVATPLTDDMLDRMLAVAFDPMTPDPGIDLPSFDIDLNDFADDAHHDDIYASGLDDHGIGDHDLHHGGVDTHDDADDGDDLSDFFDAPDDGALGHDFGDYGGHHDGDLHDHGLTDHGFGHHGFADGLDDDLLGGM